MNSKSLVFLAILSVATVFIGQAMAQPSSWRREWPRTDFSKSSVDFADIMSGGPPKDGIPAIDHPQFEPLASVHDIGSQEPVIVVTHGGEAKAYPVRILMWHEIANDTVGGMPVTVTYCPLCNASIVFDRRLDGKILDFGVSGMLRFSDMVMYDRQSESWWQQFLGVGIVGEMTDKKLRQVPSRVMPFGEFKTLHPRGIVLVPNNRAARRYGSNAYTKYDSSETPFLYRGRYDGPVPAMAYVIAIGSEAWPLARLRERGEIRRGDLVLRWHEGMNSALDTRRIAEGRDIGFVTVERVMQDGSLRDEVYNTTFAFAFMAFTPEGVIYAN